MKKFICGMALVATIADMCNCSKDEKIILQMQIDQLQKVKEGLIKENGN